MIHLALIGGTEWLMVAAVLVFFFGARKLPELGRAMGMSITEFRRGLRAPEEAPKAFPEHTEAAPLSPDSSAVGTVSPSATAESGPPGAN